MLTYLPLKLVVMLFLPWTILPPEHGLTSGSRVFDTMQETIQGLIGALPLEPEAKFYLASMADKAGHKITDALGMSKGRGTFTEGLLSDRGKKELDMVAKSLLSQGKDIIEVQDYLIYPDYGSKEYEQGLQPDRFMNALGTARIIGEDADNVYIRDKYDFGYKTLDEIGLFGPGSVFDQALQARDVFSLAQSLVPLVSYMEPDTRAPRVELKIPKQTPGVFYSPSRGGEKAVPKPKPKTSPKPDWMGFHQMLRGPIGD